MKKRVIWKWSLGRLGEQVIEIPRGAMVLTVQKQHGAPQIWAYCDPTEPKEAIVISVIGTGIDIPAHPGDYIGTIQEGEFVWHIFKRCEASELPEHQNENS